MVKRKPKEQWVTMSPYLHKSGLAERHALSQDGADDGDAQEDPSPSLSPAPSQQGDDSPQRSSPGQSTLISQPLYTKAFQTTEAPRSMRQDQATDSELVTLHALSTHLLALQDNLTAALTTAVTEAVSTAVKELQNEITEIGNRTDKLESIADNIILRQSSLEEENALLKDELQQITNMCEDLENRSRRQNLRVRGVPEDITPQDIPNFLSGLFTTLCPDIPPDQWKFDRGHRSLGLKPPLTKPPRDIIMCLHYFEQKELILTKVFTEIIYLNHKVQVYADLSPITLGKRRELKPITQRLRDMKIPYHWGYPFKLIAQQHGQTYILQNPNRGIPNKLPPSPKDNQQKPALRPQWQQVGRPPSQRRLPLNLSPSSERQSESSRPG
uniref:Uncharacterized protein n=1 Tax=Xenopus tropicalis TaxID=8364 RepID=A0A1B8Y4F1_XENTR